ncbi:MAG: Na+/H+ antiporter subunit E [Proteobacteria bacterium]|nr:Na+/H+ antiporter subunit E [Pseudomonadota bacterium]
MLQAIALFCGVFSLWLLLEQRFTAIALLAAVGVAALCVMLTARLSGLGRGTFTLMPKLAAMHMARAGVAIGDAIRTVGAAIAADVKLRPALVRVRTRAGDTLSSAALANLIAATPGAIVIASDAEGLLVHVNDEADERFNQVRDWEASLARGQGTERRS